MTPVVVNLMGGRRLGGGWDLMRKPEMDTVFIGQKNGQSLLKEVSNLISKMKSLWDSHCSRGRTLLASRKLPKLHQSKPLPLKKLLNQPLRLVLESPVRSGFLPKNGLTVTVTGLLFFSGVKKLDLTAMDRLMSVY